MVLLLFVLAWLKEKKISYFDVLLIIFIFCFSLSLLTSINIVSSIKNLGTFTLKTAGIAFIVKRVIRSSDYEKVVNVFVLTAFLIALIGILEFVGEFFFSASWNPYFKFSPEQKAYIFGNYIDTVRMGIKSTMGHPLIV
ncbi:MAG: hypothetical protein AB1633_08520, partial [Elusimicrobiota bacterium]